MIRTSAPLLAIVLAAASFAYPQSSGLPAPSLATAPSPCAITTQVPGAVDSFGNAINCTPVSRYVETDLVFTATPVFTASTLNYLPLTGNVTSSTIAPGLAGQHMAVVVCQDSVGLHTLVWPTNTKGGPPIASLANKCSATVFIYVTAINAWVAISPGVVGL